ncbi:unnamed protein product, partial [Prorocentrum cordatum]
VVLPIGCGEIVYYDTKRFVAYCKCKGHVKCSRERKSVAGVRPAIGRPLGLLAAWLRAGDSWHDKKEHCDIGMKAITIDDRREGRREIELLAEHGNAAAAQLLASERELRPGEGPEPTMPP